MKTKGKLVWIPEDVLKDIDKIKVDTGIRSNSDALRSAFNKIRFRRL